VLSFPLPPRRNLKHGEKPSKNENLELSQWIAERRRQLPAEISVLSCRSLTLFESSLSLLLDLIYFLRPFLTFFLSPPCVCFPLSFFHFLLPFFLHSPVSFFASPSFRLAFVALSPLFRCFSADVFLSRCLVILFSVSLLFPLSWFFLSFALPLFFISFLFVISIFRILPFYFRTFLRFWPLFFFVLLVSSFLSPSYYVSPLACLNIAPSTFWLCYDVKLFPVIPFDKDEHEI